MEEYIEKRLREEMIERDASFYAESNIRYLEGIVQDIKDGKAHFAEHESME